MVIRCKVYIDNFSRIQIFHNSVKLDLDGLATLRVRAFDSEDNVFSSLVGLQFVWHLIPETDGPQHHLVHIPLKDSPVSDNGDLNIQTTLEESGVFSDLFVVKGTEIGQESVSVTLAEPQYTHMSDKIVLTVAEAMSLDPPSPVFVLPGAIVYYTLKVIRANIPQYVPLPSPFHQWSVSNSSVADVDQTRGEAHALSLGATVISVEDTRVAGHIQTSSLHVVLPESLSLYMLPVSSSGDVVEGINPIQSVSRWYVVSGRQYIIGLKVFSQGPFAREIYITETDDLKLHDDQSEYWTTYPVPDSIAVKLGWSNTKFLKATSYGMGTVTATLKYRSIDDAKEVLKLVQEVKVCDEVRFSMYDRTSVQTILLPWAPGVNQEVELKAEGGCSLAATDYKWFSTDTATVSVSAYGTIQAKRPGKATITVVSVFDSFNFDEVAVEVSIPTSMVMLPDFPVEAPVRHHLAAAVTLKASNGANFYKCDAFSSAIKWNTGNESFVIMNTTHKTVGLKGIAPDISEEYELLHGPPCAYIRAYGSRSGRTMLHATLTKEYQPFEHSFAVPLVLTASTCIAAFLPLFVHQVGDGNQFGGYWFDVTQAEALDPLNLLYLVPGTSVDVMLRDGPEPWQEGVKFFENVEILDEGYGTDGVIVHKMSTGYGRPYRISCRKLGNFKLVFFVGEENLKSAKAEAKISLRCSFPDSVVVLADKDYNRHMSIRGAAVADRNSGRIRATPITVANGCTIRLSAVGVSDSGDSFANSSSLYLNWETSKCDGLAYWDDASILLRTKSSWERFLVLQNSTGSCIVRATVIGFTGTMKLQDKITPFENSKTVLTDAISLQLVSNLRVSPEFSLLLYHPDAKLNLSITGGSCFLDTFVNDTGILQVIKPEPGSQCSQIVVSPRGIGTSLVTVHDIGLFPPLEADSLVQVAELDWIKINSRQEISLMEGSTYNIGILAGDISGNTFESSQYMYMNIDVHVEDHIVELVDDFGKPTSTDGYFKAPNFIIRARKLGFTTLYVSARQQSGQEIVSQHITIEVYAPPILNPSEIFLVPGASYVLSVNGGPTIGSYVEYSAADNLTAVVHKTFGKLSAVAVGNSTLVANIYGNGDKLICQAVGSIEVGVPLSAKLMVQGEQLAVGRSIPIFPYLSQGNLFSFYEVCNNYKWTVEDEHILNFQGAEHLEELGFIQVLYGISAGKTKVAVSFSCDFVSSGLSQSRIYSASLSLSIIPELPLALGAPITWLLPPHYTTSSLLPLSSLSYSQGEGQSRKGTISYSILREISGKNEEAVSIDSTRIITGDSNTLACIHAKDRLTGRIEVASCVKVAEISQVRITNKAFPFPMINLAAGAEMDIGINYSDTLGNPFHEAYDIVLFEAETNYGDVISISDTLKANGTINLKAIQPGKALVRVSFVGDCQKSDYVLVSVGLYSQNPVLDIISQTTVSVVAPSQSLTNIPYPAEGYNFSVKFSSEGRSLILYDCVVDPAFVGYAKPWTDVKTGKSCCLFYPYTPEHLMRSVPNLKDTRKGMSVSISASARGADHVSGSASALFIGGFSILEMGKSDSLQLNMSQYSNKTIITVVGNTDVYVHWQERDLLTIVPVYKEDNGIGGRAVYEVKVAGQKRFRDKVVISLPGNGQRMEIDVNYEPRKGRVVISAEPASSALWGVKPAMLLGFLVALVAVLIWLLNKPGRPQPISEPATPLTVGRVTPDHSSPRTPQPFVEYLRRTIDETPNYRRETRRRVVNPQNTF
jgi:nuclear pore complex protein Nup210